jgi:hypothetical protein
VPTAVSEAARKGMVKNIERIAKTNTPAGRRAKKALENYHRPETRPRQTSQHGGPER